MNGKWNVMALALAGILCVAPASYAGRLDAFSDALEELAEMTRSADRAHDAWEDAVRGKRDYERYERDWYERESRLEHARVRTVARMADVSESRIRELRRQGYGWDRIARQYNIDSRRFGYGLSRYDHERDRWKGVPPGLAKKGGLPPGQVKKLRDSPHKKHKD